MLEAVRSRARSYFEDAPPAHDWHHVRRVAALAETLIDRHPDGDAVDERVVTLAIYLHDIGREREDRGEIDDHATWGAREAGEILTDVGADPDAIERVRHCVRTHRYSNAAEPETLEAKIVSDADNLDALGAVGLARVFAHGGAAGSPIHDVGAVDADAVDGPGADSDSPGAQSTDAQYDHIHEKILDLPDRMYTEPGRELADARVRFVREYVRQFDAELAGET
ncbi:HD domain-containing protein [Halopiger xanaduensis]|uniref:Metal dependent phosphohydrolase n=1 Tax=Halopiger xanaduensis (strain DSM 18323 / JCM 14033 / SH-6) TaxID=797210 RepID=F8DBD4_HALXS|nr:HD domain-containing protein [Halopiger xanaduensis]AEH35916.1 metal dependent phosphohydrolase [Halopiger xanaduensis SH-6]